MNKITISHLHLVSHLLDSPIAFNPAFARVVGNDLAAGMLLSQLFYWAKTKNFGEFYKVNEELQKECFLGRTEFENARKKILDAGIFTVTKKDIPCKTFYQINLEQLCEKLLELKEPSQFAGNQQTRVQETSKLECRKPANWNAGNQHSIIITENTTENTTETINPLISPKGGEEEGHNPFLNSLKLITLNAIIDKKMQFTQDEIYSFFLYLEAKPGIKPHNIRINLDLIQVWADEQKDVISSLLQSQTTKTIISPKLRTEYNSKGERIYDINLLRSIRNKKICTTEILEEVKLQVMEDMQSAHNE